MTSGIRFILVHAAILLAGIGVMSISGCAKKEQPVVVTIAPVKCYSNGVLVYEGNARGKVWVSYDSPRVEFKSAETGKTVIVSGMCVVGE